MTGKTIASASTDIKIDTTNKDQFEITSLVIGEFLKTKEFTRKILEDTILQYGGSLKIAAGITLSSYLGNLEEANLIEYDGSTEKYINIKLLTKRRPI